MSRAVSTGRFVRAAATAALWLGLAVASIGAVRPELRPWPGPGFRTEQGSFLRPLFDGVRFTPLVSVGDSLVPPKIDDDGFLFFPKPAGIGVQSVGRGLAEIYVPHGTTWQDGVGSGRVSRLLLDQESRRVLAADWIVDGVESFEGLSGGTLATTHEGFLVPQFLFGENSLQGPNHGVAAAVSVRSGIVAALPWLGRFRHEAMLFLPITNGRVTAILTESGYPGQSEIYMYRADSDTDFLGGRGELLVFHADAPRDVEDTQLASMARKNRPLTGRFVPVRGFSVEGDPYDPAAVELGVKAARALRFARLGDAAPDRRNASAFYFADQGDEDFNDPVSGRPVSGDGRIYRLELDSFDATLVRELRVVLDGDEADDLYRPCDLETDERGLMIQENPGRRGIHPSRILRYDFNTRQLDPLAECAERDPQGRLIPAGTGGVWRTTGIVDASDVFGAGTWLVSVQAPNDYSSAFVGRGGAGQLLLMKTPVVGEATKAEKERGKREKKEKEEAEKAAAESERAGPGETPKAATPSESGDSAK
ncbi:MAG TPA: hypothetical protein VFU59_05465 [Candidatus Eisenbacteria bacterium]|nr:hypothetical protein [Candidatus Eisenbacteria bacterium]